MTAHVVSPVPGSLPPSSQVRPSSIQGADVYGPHYLGGSTTVVGGTGGGGQIGAEGFAPPASNDPVPVAGPDADGGGLIGSGAGAAILILIGLAIWSYLDEP